MEIFAQLISERLNPANLPYAYSFNLQGAVNAANFLNQQVKNHILEPASIFEQNIRLKKVLVNNIPDNPYAAYFWIIRRWGGIGAFTEGDNNLQLINNFLSSLENQEILTQYHGKISSLSKVASFIRPNDYAIYDARAVYTLNWLISEAVAERPDFEINFFPISQGVTRNNMIKNRPLALIYQRCPLVLHYPTAGAYLIYCALLQQLTPYLFPEYPTEIFRTEMLLFANVAIAYNNLDQNQMRAIIFP